MSCSIILSVLACIYVTYRVFKVDGVGLPWLLPFMYLAVLATGFLLSIPGFILIARSNPSIKSRRSETATSGKTLKEIMREKKGQA